jgi:uncharacterized membrane protein YgdD (TMEM256/DUF423 family)
MSDRVIIYLGIILCCISIIVGAFGAHALESVIFDKMDVFNTGNEYQSFHSLALIIVGSLSKQFKIDLSYVAYLFVAGILLFSGSLYSIAIFKLSYLGIVTPIGGICFIIGWILLLVKLYK